MKPLKPLTDGAKDEELKGSLAKEIGPQITIYLHTEGHIHRDIKPVNILVKSIEPFVFVLADFGFTCRDHRKTSAGTQVYAAPEIHLRQQYWTDAVDIRSIGVVIIQYTGGLPLPPTQWDHNAWPEALAAVVPAPGPFGEALGRLALAMLDHDPDGRPTAQFCLTKVKMILKGGWTGTSLGKRAQNKHPITPSSPLFDDISPEDLRSWVLRDNDREPSTAINLTRICWDLSLSKNEMRTYIKKEGHAFYVIHASKNQGRHTYKGTYVSIPCAIAFVRKCRPELKEVLSDLEDLRSSSKLQSPNQGLTVSSDASRFASSPNLIRPLQGGSDMMLPNADNLGFSPSIMLLMDSNLEPFASVTEEEWANFIETKQFPGAPGEGH